MNHSNLLRNLFLLVICSSLGSCLLFWSPPSRNSFDPRISQGWTQFLPSTDSRILYVSNSGSDASARVYSPQDPQVGQNPFLPIGEIHAFSSYSAALEQVRDGYPDWVLFRRGDVFSTTLDPAEGRSYEEKALIASWGPGSTSPMILPPDPETAILFKLLRRGDNIRHSALVGLDFYSPTRDPTHPNYQGPEGDGGFIILIGGTGPIDGESDQSGILEDFLIEGCRFRFFTGNNIQVLNDTQGYAREIVLRRNRIENNYSAGNAHSQGMFSSGIDGLLLEENIFYHNGWNRQADQDGITQGEEATIFNHNLYYYSTKNARFLRNISIQPSSMNFKFTSSQEPGSAGPMLFYDNLFIDGEIGIGIGGNLESPDRFHDITIQKNVFTEIGRSRPTNRYLGWSLDIRDWNLGLVEGNLFIHGSNTLVNNVHGISFAGGVKNVRIRNNRFYGLRGYVFNVGELDDILWESPMRQNVHIYGNRSWTFVESPSLIAREIQGLDLGTNYLYTPIDPEYRFRLTHEGELVFADLNLWNELTAGNTIWEETKYFQPERDLSSFDLQRGGQGDLDDLISRIREQSLEEWDETLMANHINSWLRVGFQIR